MHGARVIALRGNFDQALTLVRALADDHPIALVNSVNRFRLEGQKTGSFELLEVLGEFYGLCIPVAMLVHHGVLEGLRRGGRQAAAVRVPGRGRGPAGARPQVDHPETIASAIRIGNPARWEEAMEAMTASRGEDPARSPTPRSSAPTGFSAAREGVFGQPASAASVAGLLRYGAGGARRIACVLTGHGLRIPGPRSDQAGGVDRLLAEPVRGRGGRAGRRRRMRRRRLVRVPASSANLGPGFDSFCAALALHVELEVIESGRFGVETKLDIARDRRNLAVRGFAKLHPPDTLHLPHPLDDPAVGRAGLERRGLRRGAPAPPRTSSSTTATCSPDATELEGHPDNAAAALLRRLRHRGRGRGRALRSAVVARGGASSCARGRCARRSPGASCRRPCRSPTRSRTSPTERCSPLRLARGDLSLIARGLRGPPAPALPGAPLPAVDGAARACRPSSARSARACRARARPCCSGRTPTRRARSSPRCAARRTAGRDVIRAPFETPGADVREL